MQYFGYETDECSWHVRLWIWLFTVLVRLCPREIKEMKFELTTNMEEEQ